MASVELREELEAKDKTNLEGMIIANGLLSPEDAKNVSKEDLVELLMEAADNLLPPEAERDAP